MKVVEYALIIKKKYNLKLDKIIHILSNFFEKEKLEFFEKNENISFLNQKKLNSLFKKYSKGMPEQYFYNYLFFLKNKIYINKFVLIPRFETEFMVEKVILEIEKYFKNKINLNILDVGTGSGCIAIAMASKLSKNSLVDAIDSSKKTIRIAKKNVALNALKNVECFKSVFFSKVFKQYDVIISNPPYISRNDTDLSSFVKKYEPSKAFLSKKNGLYHIEKIIIDAKSYLKKKALLIIEFGYKQKLEVEKIISANLVNVHYNFYKDLSNNWRFVVIKFK